ncbi:MAG: hypothetical protein KJO34_02025, partial [Deltaproteobacteria bacterium]|nr:hypothetical protein [Deltaproteobacteria bacterium]
MQIITALLVAAISGLLLYACFPSAGLSFLIWIGLVPLFLVISGRSAKQGFFVALVCGMTFFLGLFNWIFEIPRYTLVHHAM